MVAGHNEPLSLPRQVRDKRTHSHSHTAMSSVSPLLRNAHLLSPCRRSVHRFSNFQSSHYAPYIYIYIYAVCVCCASKKKENTAIASCERSGCAHKKRHKQYRKRCCKEKPYNLHLFKSTHGHRGLACFSDPLTKPNCSLCVCVCGAHFDPNNNNNKRDKSRMEMLFLFFHHHHPHRHRHTALYSFSQCTKSIHPNDATCLWLSSSSFPPTFNVEFFVVFVCLFFFLIFFLSFHLHLHIHIIFILDFV